MSSLYDVYSDQQTEPQCTGEESKHRFLTPMKEKKKNQNPLKYVAKQNLAPLGSRSSGDLKISLPIYAMASWEITGLRSLIRINSLPSYSSLMAAPFFSTPFQPFVYQVSSLYFPLFYVCRTRICVSVSNSVCS